jgi:hypothetical protein
MRRAAFERRWRLRLHGAVPDQRDYIRIGLDEHLCHCQLGMATKGELNRKAEPITVLAGGLNQVARFEERRKGSWTSGAVKG